MLIRGQNGDLRLARPTHLSVISYEKFSFLKDKTVIILLALSLNSAPSPLTFSSSEKVGHVRNQYFKPEVALLFQLQPLRPLNLNNK